jgi:hypothetical protein
MYPLLLLSHTFLISSLLLHECFLSPLVLLARLIGKPFLLSFDRS